MKKTILALSTIAILATSCKNEVDPFLVKEQNIGMLTDSTQIKDLDIIFAKDSIVKPIAGDEFAGSVNTIEVYETGGKHLLSITPKQALPLQPNTWKHIRVRLYQKKMMMMRLLRKKKPMKV